MTAWSSTSSTRMRGADGPGNRMHVARSVTHPQRHAQVKAAARLRGARDLKSPSHELKPFADAEETEAGPHLAGLGMFQRVEPGPLVAHGHAEGAIVECDADLRSLHPAVLGAVEQQLAHGFEHEDFHLLRQRRVVCGPDGHVDLEAFRHSAREPLQPGLQTSNLENRRAQIAGEGACHFNGLVDQCYNPLRFGGGNLRLPGKTGHLQLDGGQELLEVVVQDFADAAALPVLHQRQLAGQGSQLPGMVRQPAGWPAGARGGSLPLLDFALEGVDRALQRARPFRHPPPQSPRSRAPGRARSRAGPARLAWRTRAVATRSQMPCIRSNSASSKVSRPRVPNARHADHLAPGAEQRVAGEGLDPLRHHHPHARVGGG